MPEAVVTADSSLPVTELIMTTDSSLLCVSILACGVAAECSTLNLEVRVLACHRSCALGKGTLHDFPHFARKDYEIVSPECGDLRILRYNSGRHDSTSMIFGRQITAVEAEVKYKFRLRGGSVRHKSPTYICLETADSWI
ncbi:hypothetical protein Bbelb_397790 [Branchiostoma belcheri]|nr:hypothetical protein Bbelb_397790 [Branchiostoma belcheri]